MWETRCNLDQAIDPFNIVLDKGAESKGDFGSDFHSFCETYNIIKCPHIVVVPGSKANTEVVRVANADIDISNWRAALLSSAVMGSKVCEIYVHACKLTAQHLADLAITLVKIGTIKSLKLQYIEFVSISENEAAYLDAFKSLFSDATNLTMISLLHCGLNDTIGQIVTTSLSSNFCLIGLNLSYNNFTESTLRQLIGAIRYTTNLKYIIMRGNQIQGDAVEALISQFIGSEAAATDEVAVKTNNKALTDKNKAIKDANKKRKKAGHIELSEYNSFAEILRKVGGKNILVNTSLELLDVAENDVSPNVINNFAKLLDEADAATVSNLSFQLRVSTPRCDGLDADMVSKHERIVKIV
jgi:hypothetical protein